MAKYRKKPVVIEAVQFDGTDESVDWLLPQLKSGEIGRSCNRLHIKTLEGVMTANIGDYIIKGVNGEFYPCKPDIFETTYERVPSEPLHPLVNEHTVASLPSIEEVNKKAVEQINKAFKTMKSNITP